MRSLSLKSALKIVFMRMGKQDETASSLVEIMPNKDSRLVLN
jgi:hypothetical protein